MVDEAFGVFCVSVVQHGLSHGYEFVGTLEVDIGRREITNAGMAMLVVVPGKETRAVREGMIDATEALGEIGSVLDGLEVRFRERIVVRDMWP
jgi:hypothetical protein